MQLARMGSPSLSPPSSSCSSCLKAAAKHQHRLGTHTHLGVLLGGSIGSRVVALHEVPIQKFLASASPSKSPSSPASSPSIPASSS
jgi:hypothetical protein